MTWTDISSSPQLVLQHSGSRHSYESPAVTATPTAAHGANKNKDRKRKAESPPPGIQAKAVANSESNDKRQRATSLASDHNHPLTNSGGNHNSINGGSSRRRQRSSESNLPRWHSQSYLLFLALRQHPTKSLPRTDLIKAALALDEKISKERNIPRVFRGKTPSNSASAILTNNIDRYFVPFRPHGSRCMHFKLAFDPGNLKDAVEEYTKWETRLAQEEWPLYFGKQKRKQDTSSSSSPPPPSTPITTKPSSTAMMTEFDAFLLSKRQQPKKNHLLFEDVDLSLVPKTWRDLMRFVETETGTATIQEHHQEQGQQHKRDEQEPRVIVVATRAIPGNTPVGFYFGVPMTTDEFDSLKDGVGLAAEYSITYKSKTVLDPTDEKGRLYSKDVVLCPFHYMRSTSSLRIPNIHMLEGPLLNQIVCWTRRDIAEGEELVLLRNNLHGDHHVV